MNVRGLGSKFPAEGSYLTYAMNSKLKAIPRHKLKKTYGRVSPGMQYLFNQQLRMYLLQLGDTVQW